MKNLGLFMQEHYCERMSRCFVINSPGFFNVLWRCVIIGCLHAWHHGLCMHLLLTCSQWVVSLIPCNLSVR
jgi:CRAL/TRIO domain